MKQLNIERFARRETSFFSVIILLLVTLCVPPISSLAGERSFHIISSSSEEIIFEYKPPQFRQNVRSVDGVRYTLFETKGTGLTSDEGKPQLPEDGVLVGIPPNVTVHLEVLESKFDVQPTEVILPAPRYIFDDNNEAKSIFHRDDRFYETHTQFYPEDVVRVGDIARIRDQRVAKIIVHPLQYNPAARQLKRLTHLLVKCRFTSVQKASATDWRPTNNDPQSESWYKSLLMNYAQAKEFRGRENTTKQQKMMDASAWFAPGRTYYRLPIAQDGMYRLTFQQLNSAGLNLLSTDINSLALYYNGNSIPCYVDTSSGNTQDWHIDFYARRNYGTNSYFDLYSDTNSYWLTAGDNYPRRFQIDPSSPGTPVQVPQGYTRTIHFEQDVKYYFGYNQDEIANTNEVPGEGWYWADFFPGTVWSYTFSIDSVKRAAGGNVSLRARFFGMTKTATPSQHNAQVQLNNISVGQISWSDNTEALFSASFPDTVLHSGANTVKITSVATSSPVNKFYIDWFEVDHNRPFVALNNQLDFTSDASQGISKYTISGVTADSMDVYDITGSRKIIGGSISSGSFSFQDTASAATHYVLISKDTLRSVPFIETKIFTDLRHNRDGADYLVIAHRDFIDAARRLAQARASRDGLRTIVVDVQDIYDEFNFGQLKPDALRDFLKFTYYNWPQPAPTYVVMFGDACWDFKGHLSTTIKKNYVPAFGNPPSDNALVSFDSVQNYLPYMLIGRLPVENALQADRLVTKILNYDNAPLDVWNKNCLFITGGTDSSEQSTFDFYSEDLINNNIITPPVEGNVNRVYKTSSIIIDGDSKLHMQHIFNQGVGFVNFIGHSGGRIWNVDVGSPNDLQNTTGKLPFLSSVSCNVGFFSAPNFNVLSEDFLLADNRGAAGVWAASSVGYAVVGWRLAEKFLSSAAEDYGRSFGQLTTVARINFWEINGVTTPVVIQTLQLHPLLGDPYSIFALPLKPDFDVTSGDLHLNTDQPTSDSSLTLKVVYRNFGLVPTDSILVSLRDSYTDVEGKFAGESDIVAPFNVSPLGSIDSFSVRWDVRNRPGTHVVTSSLDPYHIIPEVQKNNNTAQKIVYVYKNTISSLKPVNFSVVKPGVQNLVASLPATTDTAHLTYFFEIDTLQDFTSAVKIASPPIMPGVVRASWQTPALQDHQTYFWRARDWDGNHYGAWTLSQFTTSDSVGTVDSISWCQSQQKQFVFDTLANLTPTDSGVTLHTTNGLPLYIRSVGARVYPDSDYYSIIKIDQVTVFGLYFFGAYSYLAARIDPQTGAYQAKGYDLRNSGQTDSLISFLQNTPYGYYVALSAVSDGKTNVTEQLYQQIEALGSIKIRSVLTGQSWCLLSRKGSGAPLMTPLESYSPSAIAIVQYQMPNYYSNGNGEILSLPIGPAHHWLSLTWKPVVSSASTSLFLTVYGIKQDSTRDSLMSVPNSTTSVDLSSIDQSVYPRLQLGARLSNTDGIMTPILQRWNVLYLPPPDLATSAWAIHSSSSALQSGDTLVIDVDVYNIGYKNADSGKVTVLDIPSNAILQQQFFGVTAKENSRHIQCRVVPPSFPPAQIIRVQFQTVNDNDLFPGNNTVDIPFTITGGKSPSAEQFEMLFDGKHVVNGDYVSSRPFIQVRINGSRTDWQRSIPLLKITLDGREIFPSIVSQAKVTAIQESESSVLQFRPTFNDGQHILILAQGSSSRPDSAMYSVHFNVMSQVKLLNVYNYPNPFRDETAFSFVLTGANIAEDMEIKIYTVAGRLIKNIELPAGFVHVGFNRIVWDGRDAEGDEIANGNYLAKLIIKTAAGEDERVQKIVKLR